MRLSLIMPIFTTSTLHHISWFGNQFKYSWFDINLANRRWICTLIIGAQHFYASSTPLEEEALLELEESPRGIRRRVVATTSQRIRHWHPDVYEDVSASGSSVLVARSKSSPTRIFQHHQPPTAAVTPVPHFAVPLVSPARSPLNSTITLPGFPASLLDSEASGIGDDERLDIVHGSPPSSPSSEGATSSVSEHDVLMTPSSILRRQIGAWLFSFLKSLFLGGCIDVT